VTVEMELPVEIWEALCLVSERVGESPDERAARYLEEMLVADAEDGFRDDGFRLVDSLSREILQGFKIIQGIKS